MLIKLINGLIGKRDHKYFIDVSPKDAFRKKHNPLRLAGLGTLEYDEIELYNKLPTPFRMDYNAMKDRLAESFRRILGMAFAGRATYYSANPLTYF